MSIKKKSSSELIHVVRSFIPEILVSELEVQQLGLGHIHESYLIQQSGTSSWILQRMNTLVFTKPKQVEENHLALIHLFKGESIDTLGIQLPEVVPYSAQSLYYWDADHQPWRLYTFYGEHFCYEYCPSLEIARKAGKAFGRFSRVLNKAENNLENEPEKYDPERVEAIPEKILRPKPARIAEAFKHTIDAFHSIHHRAHQHHAARARYHGPLHLSTVQGSHLLPFDLEAWNITIEHNLPMLMAMENDLSSDEGHPYNRLSHNDAKLNNLLLHPENEPAVILDLDTVMPGSLLFDLGDGLRSIATSTKEDEPDLAQVCIHWDYYQQYEDAFLAEVNSMLNQDEQRYISFAGPYMTFIMGLRFYTDFLDGNRYYSCNYPEHNLVRARNQFHLFHQMMEKVNG
jgi:N-acetylhexosamine 1-kinase